MHAAKNGYFSPEGVPYHAVETLLVEAPDYGHETTSEAYSYWMWLEAAYGTLHQGLEAARQGVGERRGLSDSDARGSADRGLLHRLAPRGLSPASKTSRAATPCRSIPPCRRGATRCSRS